MVCVTNKSYRSGYGSDPYRNRISLVIGGGKRLYSKINDWCRHFACGNRNCAFKTSEFFRQKFVRRFMLLIILINELLINIQCYSYILINSTNQTDGQCLYHISLVHQLCLYLLTKRIGRSRFRNIYSIIDS